jgi:hypothetical protein
MTEPDEALLWARGQNGDPAKPRTVTSSYRAGLMAHGYRAGQAASAEQIKALEEALLGLASASTERIKALEAGVSDAIAYVEFQKPNAVDLDQLLRALRALLKEADQ